MVRHFPDKETGMIWPPYGCPMDARPRVGGGGVWAGVSRKHRTRRVSEGSFPGPADVRIHNQRTSPKRRMRCAQIPLPQ
jgi:hypothetical protein